MLFGEQAIAEEYHVAIGTIRSAIEELRSRGLAVTYPGKGTYVRHGVQAVQRVNRHWLELALALARSGSVKPAIPIGGVAVQDVISTS
jgi:DNA-binding GntR family transcriptional regulator